MKFRNRLIQFMQGRNGIDAFGVFLNRLSFGCIIGALVFTFVSLICLRHAAPGAATVFRVLYYIAYGLGILLLAFWLFRVLSRNVAKRQKENTRFLYQKQVLHRKWTAFKQLFDRKYKYFNCPNCGKRMRAPRKKGKIRVDCSVCHHIFITKT